MGNAQLHEYDSSHTNILFQYPNVTNILEKQDHANLGNQQEISYWISDSMQYSHCHLLKLIDQVYFRTPW